MTDQTSHFRAALVQLRSGGEVAKNVDEAVGLIRAAARDGAQYIQTPENTALMELERDRLLAATRPEDGNPALKTFQALAKELGVWLHLGSVAVLVDTGKIANRSFVISPEGKITARYDKIHMFDVDLPGGESYRESRNYEAGQQAVVANLPWGGLGLSICYDLRFPYLYRALAHAGAKFIAVPAAFTRVTGEAHWQALLRARAIETQCFVFAAAQGGRHDNGRETYGHSLIVSPWGKILAEGGTDPGHVIAEIDTTEVDTIRAQIPSLVPNREVPVVKTEV